MHYQYAYNYQTWQGGDLPWRVPTGKVTWPFDHTLLRDHLTNYKFYIFTMRMAMKLSKMVAYLLNSYL